MEEIKAKYKEYLNEEKLPYIECKKCGKRFYYPKYFCPNCGSEEFEVKVSSGRGKVFSFTKFKDKDEEVIYGIVELEEGFRMYTNFIGEVEIGDEVFAVFESKNGIKIPLFRRSL